MSELSKALDGVEELLRQGQGAKAQRALLSLPLRSKSAQTRARLAQLSWRLDRADLGAKLLNPIVRPTGKKAAKASPEERAEYAACLIRLGAAAEGGEILESLSEACPPQGHLYRAFALVSEWRYGESVAPLKRYLAQPGLSAYQRLVGGVNLAAALVFERRYAQANTLLRQLIDDGQDLGAHLLVANALELAAQNQIGAKEYARAEDLLARAARLVESESLSALLIRKWRSVLRLYQDGKRALAEVRAVRGESERLRYWEGVRDCDRAQAVALKDAELWLHVYAGSPFPAYREQLTKDLAGDPPGETYLRRFGGGRPAGRLDLAGGASSDALKPGQLLHRLLSALAGDFYRPQRPATLHRVLFPDEHYNPLSSPARVREAIRRARRLLEKEVPPLKIREAEGAYRFEAESGAEIVVPLSAPDPKRRTSYHSLRTRLSGIDESFSVEAAGKVLRMPERSVRRLLSAAVAEGELVRTGKGPATRYSFKG